MRLWFVPVFQWIQYLPLFNKFKASSSKSQALDNLQIKKIPNRKPRTKNTPKEEIGMLATSKSTGIILDTLSHSFN